MKNILVPVPQSSAIAPVLDAAIGLGTVFGSVIEGLALGPNLASTFAGEFPIDTDYLHPDRRRQVVAEAHQAFEAHMAARSIRQAASSPEATGYDWRLWDLADDIRVGSYGRLFDLIVLGRPAQDQGAPRIGTVETALFESGRPLLLIPGSHRGPFGGHVAIAWNSSTETARAVANAMPLLKRAETVTVLTIEGWAVDGPGGEDLAERLRRHGIKADWAHRPSEQGAGASILRHAGELGADMLVKGAYTQSRLRQMIFGGATSHLLTKAEVPLFIAH